MRNAPRNAPQKYQRCATSVCQTTLFLHIKRVRLLMSTSVQMDIYLKTEERKLMSDEIKSRILFFNFKP